MPWSPAAYLRHRGHRLRPALDLLAAVAHDAPALVWDLGCGTGDITAILADRWPTAEVHGLDQSGAMLAQAPPHERITWTAGDIATWTPPSPPDVVFSNAALHWVPDHESLLPRLLSNLAPGGTLAVQMPGNHNAPTHRVLRELAATDRWARRLTPVVPEVFVLDPDRYLDVLEPGAHTLSVWETTYLHVLDGTDPVADWVRGAAALPYLEALDADEVEDFMAEYATSIRRHHPPRPDGTTVLPFRRVFLVATV